jgi:hypothetical protein
MTDEKLARRRVLRGVGAAAGGLAASGLALTEPAAAADNHKNLSGSYLVTRRDDPPGDPNEALFVISLAAGGVFISNDISPAGLVGTGSWKQVSANRFTSTFWAGEAAGGPAGAFTVRVHVKGHVDQHRISGTYRFTVFDPTGKHVQAEGSGSFHGTRIEP